MDFSVLMSIYYKDNVKFLEEALFSIWDYQSLKPNQIVLVQDGPITEELESLVNYWLLKIGKEKFIHVVLGENFGLAIALNEGLNFCKYGLVARMDSDDISLPTRFEKQINAFKNNPSLDVLGGYAQEINYKGEASDIRYMPKSHRDIISEMYSCPVIHPTIMYKKDAILSLGGYNGKLTRRQDYELWFRCAKAGYYFNNIPDVLILYRFTLETHRKQTKKFLFKQGVIGFNGVRKLKQPLWKGLASFFPLIRSIMPDHLEHFIYKASNRFDPRRKDFTE